MKRATDEKKLRELKEQEIERLNHTLASYNDESNKLSDLVQLNMKYAHYLELVQETVPEDYPEISDLVNRYNTLKVGRPTMILLSLLNRAIGRKH